MSDVNAHRDRTFLDRFNQEEIEFSSLITDLYLGFCTSMPRRSNEAGDLNFVAKLAKIPDRRISSGRFEDSFHDIKSSERNCEYVER